MITVKWTNVAQEMARSYAQKNGLSRDEILEAFVENYVKEQNCYRVDFELFCEALAVYSCRTSA